MTETLDRLRFGATIGLVLWGLSIGMLARWQDGRIAELEADNAGLSRALTALAAEHAAELARKTRATTARDSIRSLDVSNEPPVGESLRKALIAADEIGGLQ